MTRRLPPEVENQLMALCAIGFHSASLSDETLTIARDKTITAILAACDAAERRGIERAARECEAEKAQHSPAYHSYTEGMNAGADNCAVRIRALPVPEEGA